MKIMVASDIHGSAYYCRKMIEAYKEERADRLLHRPLPLLLRNFDLEWLENVSCSDGRKWDDGLRYR